MAKMIQVRNVSGKLHRELKRRAQKEGKTLTKFVADILEREVARPPAAEVWERIARRKPLKLDRPIADLIREERRRAGRE